MIIVSQDKLQIFNFRTAKNIWIEDEEVEINQIEQIVYSIYIDGEIVGAYETEERAKEVLLEIATHNATFNLFKCSDAEKQKRALEEFLEKGIRFDIYEMPEK